MAKRFFFILNFLSVNQFCFKMNARNSDVKLRFAKSEDKRF